MVVECVIFGGCDSGGSFDVFWGWFEFLISREVI